MYQCHHCKDCLSRENSCFKEIERQGFLWVLGSVLFYVAAPYLIKVSDGLGANEIAINLSYYMLALPYFAYNVFSKYTNFSTLPNFFMPSMFSFTTTKPLFKSALTAPFLETGSL